MCGVRVLTQSSLPQRRTGTALRIDEVPPGQFVPHGAKTARKADLDEEGAIMPTAAMLCSAS